MFGDEVFPWLVAIAPLFRGLIYYISTYNSFRDLETGLMEEEEGHMVNKVSSVHPHFSEELSGRRSTC